MNISKQVVILSAERSENSKEVNAANNELLAANIKDLGLPFSIGSGVYQNGPEEVSLVVGVNSSSDIEKLKEIAFKGFNQESILHQDANQEAYLIYQNGKIQRLGRLEEVAKEVAVNTCNYTILNGKYYTVLPRAVSR